MTSLPTHNFRRSTRVPKTLNSGAAPDVSSGDEQETFVVPSDDEQDEEPVEKKAKTKKRKAATRSTTGQPPVKKPRGKRGILSELLEMPYDIVFEVFSQLHPNDLLSLMRTSKHLRSFFRSRESESLWKAARRHFEGLPECPEDLSEPQYADLAFGKGCQVCLRKVVGLHTCWSARLRICHKCLSPKFTTWVPYNVMQELKDVLPSMLIEKRGRRYRQHSVCFFQEKVDQFSKLSEEYKANKTPEKMALVENTVKTHKAILQHAQACDKWAEKYKSEIEKDKETVIDKRKAIVLDRLREAGWDDEIDSMTERQLNNLKDLPELSKACHKNLTEKVITNLLEHLKEYMTQAQKKRIKEERMNFLQHRIPIFQQFIDDYRLSIPPNDAREFPAIPDLFCHPLVRDAVDNIPVEEFEKSSFKPLEPLLPEIVADVRSSIRDQAIALVAAACGENHDIDPDTILDLATTIFSCSSCTSAGSYNCRGYLYAAETLRFPDVMYHPCARNCDYSSRQSEKDVDFAYFVDYPIATSNWNRYSQIRYKVENQKVLSEAIALCGFDPKVATFAQMDAADPILECVTCNDPYRGRATMRWSLVAAHYHAQHVKPKDGYSKDVTPLKLELLNEEDARIARKRMDEQMARGRASGTAENNTNTNSVNSMTCAHCLYKGIDRSSSVKVKEHVRAEHGIAHPTDADAVPIPSKRFNQSVFFMWPPRET